jgi:hypothetical protein
MKIAIKLLCLVFLFAFVFSKEVEFPDLFQTERIRPRLKVIGGILKYYPKTQWSGYEINSIEFTQIPQTSGIPGKTEPLFCSFLTIDKPFNPIRV